MLRHHINTNSDRNNKQQDNNNNNNDDDDNDPKQVSNAHKYRSKKPCLHVHLHCTKYKRCWIFFVTCLTVVMCFYRLVMNFMNANVTAKGESRQSYLRPRASYQHPYKIPNIAYVTYNFNLLKRDAAQLEGEDAVLAANVRNTMALVEHTSFRFLTDEDCIDLLQNYSKERNDGRSHKLEEYFRNESRGMIKADVCRGVALYNTGGLYFDVDLQVRMNVWDIIDTDTDFVVPLVHKDHKVHDSFFQAFIGVSKESSRPIMSRYLDFFLEYYEGEREVTKTKSIGVVLLRQAYDHEVHVLKNIHHKSLFWREVLYSKDLFPNIEEPVGERRACRFVVFDKITNTIPFYSRVRGSRMCGGKDSSVVKHNV